MSDGVKFDFSQLNALAADLGKVPDTAGPFINSAVQFTSRNIKDNTAQKVRRRRHFRQAASLIDYDIQVDAGVKIQADVGYNKSVGGAADLGNLIEYGAPNSPNALAPGNELQTTLHEQEDDFVKGLAKAMADAERGAGL